MLSKLPPRERQIVDILYERGALAVADICDALPDQLSGSAVRAMLKRLEDKGVTDCIVGFRVPYIKGPDTEPLETKIENLEKYADSIIAKVNP